MTQVQQDKSQEVGSASSGGDRELLELAAKAVEYSPVDGKFRWIEKQGDDPETKRWNFRYAGYDAGTLDDKGYIRVSLTVAGRKRRFRGHQLAWFMAHGTLPVGEIDHIDQDKSNNRIANLRDVSRAENQRNGTRKSNNTSGVPGVIWHKQRQKWCAQTSIGGKHHHLGLYTDIRDAEQAVKSFRAINGFTTNHGRALA